MKTTRSTRRQILGRAGVASVAVGMLLGILGLPGNNVAHAGSATVVNACQNNATGTFADLPLTLAGTDSPDPATLSSDTVDLTGATAAIDVPADLLLAGYNLGLLTVGTNDIQSHVFVARHVNTIADETNIQDAVVTAQTTITDPDGTPGTGDESATPLAVNMNLDDWTGVTPTGTGTMEWKQADPGTLGSITTTFGSTLSPNGSFFVQAAVGPGGLIKVNFDCQPGTSVDNNADGDNETFTPATDWDPFETTTVQTATTTTTVVPTTTTTTVVPTTTTTTVVPTTTTTTQPSEGPGRRVGPPSEVTPGVPGPPAGRPVGPPPGVPGKGPSKFSPVAAVNDVLDAAGEDPLTLGWLLAALGVIDLGYLGWTAVRPPRRRRTT